LDPIGLSKAREKAGLRVVKEKVKNEALWSSRVGRISPLKLTKPSVGKKKVKCIVVKSREKKKETNGRPKKAFYVCKKWNGETPPEE